MPRKIQDVIDDLNRCLRREENTTYGKRYIGKHRAGLFKLSDVKALLALIPDPYVRKTRKDKGVKKGAADGRD